MNDEKQTVVDKNQQIENTKKEKINIENVDTEKKPAYINKDYTYIW